MGTFGENYVTRLNNKIKWWTKRSKRLSDGLPTTEGSYTEKTDDKGNVIRTYTNNPDQRRYERALRLQEKADKANQDIISGKALELGNKKGETLKTNWDLTNKITGNLAQLGTGAIGLVGSQMDIAPDSTFHVAQQAAQVMSQHGTVGKLAALGTMGVSLGRELTGSELSQMSSATADAAGISNLSKFWNNFGSIAGIGGNKTNKALQRTEEAQAVSGAYPQSSSFVDAMSAAGGKTFLTGVGKLNAGMADSNIQAATMHELGMLSTVRNSDNNHLKTAVENQYNGNRNRTGIGKSGLKLPSIEDVKKILELRSDSDIQAFQNGGVIGIDVNVIPEGKYHAHRNHLSEISEEFEDLTKKGIPVVTHSEGGELEQIAEIEKMEIIFRLEVTEKLEELYKDGSEEAMIEAGKLVAVEIMENTQDNSGEVLNG